MASTVLLGAGLTTSQAAAADGVALGSGGYFSRAYLSNCRDDSAIAAFGLSQSAHALSLSQSVDCAGFGGDNEALLYISPSFAGFQVAIADLQSGDQDGGLGIHVDQPGDLDGESLEDALVYGLYSFEGDAWNLTALAGASIAGPPDQEPGRDGDQAQRYKLGVNISFGNLAVGGVLEYYNSLVDQRATEVDRWVAGAGIAYTMDAWTIGAHYARLGQESADGLDDLQQDRVSLTGNYELGSGITIDGEVGYSWIETAPEATDDTAIDAGGALEIGIGTNFTF